MPEDMTLRLLGRKWTVCFRPMIEMQDTVGFCDRDNYRITICHEESIEKQRAVLFHEILEAAVYYCNTKGLQGEASHDQLDTLGNVLYGMLAENDLIKHIL